MAHDDVELVAVDDQIALAVGGGVDRLPPDLDAAEGQAEELARELVVVAGHEHHARAAPHLAQKLLHDVVMRLRPVPARTQPPPVDDVADEVDRVGLDVPKHIEDQIGLAAARAEMEIRQEQRAVTMGPVRSWTRRPLAFVLNSKVSAQILVSLR